MHFKYVQIIVCQLYLTKELKNKKNYFGLILYLIFYLKTQKEERSSIE